MEKISDHDLDVILDVETESAEHEENWLVVKALQELKERREAEHVADTSNMMPLDIKGQMRLVRDKCPDIWDLVVTSLYACPSMIDTGLQPNLLDSKDICCGFGDENCKECWDKALEVSP